MENSSGRTKCIEFLGSIKELSQHSKWHSNGFIRKISLGYKRLSIAEFRAERIWILKIDSSCRMALRQAQAELAHVTRVTTMGELTASIAHEVNQPLAAVIANANASLRWLAAATPNLDEAREALLRIVRDGKRASDVITRIRTLVQKTDPEKTRLDINQTVQEVVLLMQNEAVRKGVALRIDLAADVPPVLGDRVQLQQVILNLVMNGIEAMNTVADRPREMVIRSSAQESDNVLLAVQDSGIGIDPRNLDKIFDTFYTTKPQGMGMGLAISRSIVENHGGKLWAVPNDGPGATFQFTILKEDETCFTHDR